MKNSKPMLVCIMQAHEFIGATVAYYNKVFGSNQNEYTDKFIRKAEDILFDCNINCYVPAGKIGKSRMLEPNEVRNILQDLKHMDRNYYLLFLGKYSFDRLREIYLNISILPYEDSEIREQLLDMLMLKHNIQESSKSGVIDYYILEKKFTQALSSGEKLSDYVKGAKKFIYAPLLGISTRSAALLKGVNHDGK